MIYSDKAEGGFSPVVNTKEESKDIEIFLASGYEGELRFKIQSYLQELKQAASNEG